MSLLPNLDQMTDNEKLAVLESIQKSIAKSKEIQKKKIGENVDLVVQALKKIESDIRDRFDAVGNSIEKRVLSIQDGRDGANGKDGRDGKDGKSGRDGLKGDRGVDGQAGRDGVDGVDGISVVNAQIDFDGSLVITLSDGRELNVGEVVSQDIAEKIKVISTMSTNGAVGIKDEGSSISTGVKNINFVGATVTATNSGDDVTVNVSAGTGTVTSVGVSGGTTGLTTTGSPITTTGTITLGGTLAVASGGTGTATPSLVAGTNITSITGTWPNQTINASVSAGTVTSVAATGGTGISVSGSPITTTGTLTITNTAPDQTVVLTAGTGINTSGTYPSFTVTNSAPDQTVALTQSGTTTITGTYPNFTISSADQFQGTVTSVTGTSPVVSSGGATPAISLAASYGDTQNPYASKTANFVLAAPNGSAGVPTFRAVVAADIPTLNQNTTGSAATLTTGRTIAITGDLAYTSPSFNGSTNVTAAGTLATVNTNVGSFTNASVTVNAKGLVTAVSNGTAGGTVTSVAATVPAFLSITGSPVTTTGTLAIGLSGTALPLANGGTAATSASAARTSLGLVIGTDVLAPSGSGASLTSLNATNISSGTLAKARLPTGTVLQVVNVQTGTVATGTGTIPFDNTIPQITEGTEYMTLAITPTSATSMLLISVVFYSSNTPQDEMTFALFQDSTANALAAVSSTPFTATARQVTCFTHKMTSGTTSATTFRVRAGMASAGTVSFNGQSGAQRFGGVAASSITIYEVAA